MPSAYQTQAPRREIEVSCFGFNYSDSNLTGNVTQFGKLIYTRNSGTYVGFSNIFTGSDGNNHALADWDTGVIYGWAVVIYEDPNNSGDRKSVV